MPAPKTLPLYYVDELQPIFADLRERLRFVGNNIDCIPKRKECCAELEVVIARLTELVEL